MRVPKGFVRKWVITCRFCETTKEVKWERRNAKFCGESCYSLWMIGKNNGKRKENKEKSAVFEMSTVGDIVAFDNNNNKSKIEV